MPEADTMHSGKWEDVIDARQYEAFLRDAIVGILLTDQEGKIIHIRRVGDIRDLSTLCKDGSGLLAQIRMGNYEMEGRHFVAALILDVMVVDKRERRLPEQKDDLAQLTAELRDLSLAYEKERELGGLKSRMLSMASHEFRTPLSTILSSISLVKRYSTPEDLHNQGRHIEKIQNAVKNLSYIMADFLSLGKLEEGLVEVSMESLSKQEFLADIDDMLQELGQSFQKDQNIELSNAINQEFIIVDRKMLRNILMNLVANAIKYSPERSVITIHCTVESGDLKISVLDRGIGIAEKDQEHLFERFFRASNVSGIQGTGLGLHIVARYLHLLGGRITLSSKLNEGTVFVVSLPQANYKEA